MLQSSITHAREVTGPIVGTVVGLGTGHLIEGRWLDKGWIFTAGETAGLALFASGFRCETVAGTYKDTTECNANTFATLGGITFLAFRIWQIVDLWATPVTPQQEDQKLSFEMGMSREKAPLLGLRYRF